MSSPDGGEGTQATWCLNVSDEANHYDWWRLDDSHSLDNLLLVQLGTRTVHIAHNVSHTSFVAEECGEVAWLGGIILREAPDLTEVLPSALPWQKAKVAVTGPLKLTMRHLGCVK